MAVGTLEGRELRVDTRDMVFGDNRRDMADQGNNWGKLLHILLDMVDLDSKEDMASLDILQDSYFQDSKVGTEFVDIQVGTEYQGNKEDMVLGDILQGIVFQDNKWDIPI